MVVEARTTFAVALCLTFAVNTIFSYDGGNYYAESLADSIRKNVQERLAPLGDLGYAINNQVRKSLEPLQNLDAKIQQQVQSGLKPVRVMESILKVTSGTSGTTFAKYEPSGKEFIIKDQILFTCEGNISPATGQCSGSLQRVSFKDKSDFCFANIQSNINNWYCIAPLGNVQVGAINGRIYCSTSDGSPSLLIAAEEYGKLCQDLAATVTYKYFTKNNIQEVGNGLTCSGDHPQVCTWTTSSAPGGNIFINGGRIDIVAK